MLQLSAWATQIERGFLSFFFLVFGWFSFLSSSLFGREVTTVGGQTREDWEVSVIWACVMKFSNNQYTYYVGEKRKQVQWSSTLPLLCD